MDVNLLEDIGMTNPQARTYKKLVEHGSSTAPALAKSLNESRTNTYKLLDKLVELGLATKQEVNKKLHYSPASPAALEQFVQKQADVIEQRERRLNAELPKLLDYYFEHSERPSIRYFEGKEGIIAIYKDQLATKQPIVFVKSPDEIPYLSFDELHHVRNLYPKFGIHRYGLVQDRTPKHVLPDKSVRVAESDTAMLLHRTWLHEQDYTAPVEWAAYGDKLSIIQYGEEAMGMVIESAPIAEAFRQLYRLLDEGIRRRPEYNKLPLKATYTALPDSFKKGT